MTSVLAIVIDEVNATEAIIVASEHCYKSVNQGSIHRALIITAYPTSLWHTLVLGERDSISVRQLELRIAKTILMSTCARMQLCPA